MSESVRVREWMNGNVCADVKFLYEKLPAYMVEHSLDILEEYDRETTPDHDLDPGYLNRVTNMLIDFAKGSSRQMTTCQSNNYDLIHELNIYLDGWLFWIDIKEDTNVETDHCYMYSFPKS